MITFIQTLILGIIEGITEFLPISSTGHLILTYKLLGIPESDFIKSFIIIIQLGAILSVLVLYYKKLFLEKDVLRKVAIAFLPTGLIGLAIYKIAKHYFLGNQMLVAWSLIIGGVLIILFENKYGKNESGVDEIAKMTDKQAFLTGVFQSLCVIPGVSRSASTIVGGRLLGLSKKTIVEFSFLLAIPIMISATVLDIMNRTFDVAQINTIVIGFIIAFISAIIGIRFFLETIKKHSFFVFGVYRIILGLAFLLLLT
jgi:undecaprenyl-diphosphatase